MKTALTQNTNYYLFDDVLEQFVSMLNDIKAAKKQILLQSFKFGNDSIGKKFLTELCKKAQEGVAVYLLLDAFGCIKLKDDFFSQLINYGGKVKFFKKIVFSFDFIQKNHRRNHRKLLIIDNKITYIGSSNITDYCINWRENCLRINDIISNKFRKIFFDNFDIADFKVKTKKNKKALARKYKIGHFEIICDVPGLHQLPTKNKVINLINEAKRSIIIASPYFLPGRKINKAIKSALERNVKVKVIIPEHSDVKLFDMIRDRNLGRYYNLGVDIHYYTVNNLHAKLFLVDDEIFMLGSSNFDYRSFFYMYEINLLGDNKNIISQINDYFVNTESDCEKFSYEKWKNRPLLNKIFATTLIPFKQLF